MVVPATALLNCDEGRQKVMVVSSDSVAHERTVAVGVRQGDRVQILSGVQEGDQVVTSGGLGLEDKAKVTIQQPKSEDEDEDDSGGDEAKPDDAKAKDAKGEQGTGMSEPNTNTPGRQRRLPSTGPRASRVPSSSSFSL